MHKVLEKLRDSLVAWLTLGGIIVGLVLYLMNLNAYAFTAKTIAEKNLVAIEVGIRERTELSKQVAVLTEKMENTIKALDENTGVTRDLINVMIKKESR